MPLRYYQQESLDRAIEWLSVSLEYGVLDLATGAGKSHIVAALASWAKGVSGKKVLCLAPSKELIEQNRAKFLATGEPASIFSGSAGKKCLKHDVVFATEKTVLNNINRFTGNFSLIIIDECHKQDFNYIFEFGLIANKFVLGFTATPKRTGTSLPSAR